MAFREKSKPQRKFKAGMDADESKRRRDDVTVTLRREKREEQLSKRRMRGAGQAAEDDDDSDDEDSKVMSQEVRDALADIQKLVTMCKGSDSEQQVEAVTQFRKLLSIERNPPIKQIIDTGIVPRLVEFLTFTHNTTLQFEAAWALTNIASGSSAHTKTVVDHGAVQIFIHLLRSPSEDVREQTVWALGNIAGDNTGYRDMVLRLGALQPVLELCHTDAKVTMLRNATWTISNFCRGKPQPPFELVRDALPALALLIQSTDDEVLTDACWALSYLSDDNGPGNHKIQAVISAGVCRRLVELLMNRNVNVKTPALRTIGNIVTGDDLQTMAVLNCGVLTCLMALLINPKKGIRKEACWTISNITAGNTDQIQAVIEARLFPPLISMLRSAEFDIQKEASWAVSNATSGGSEDQIRYLVDQGVIEPLCELFKCADSKVILVAMEGIENILKVGLIDANKHGVDNKYADDVEACGGLDSLELLQKHTNEDVYDKALKILTTYFGDEDEVTSAPAPTSGAGAFAFNAQQGAPSGGFNFS